jgi:KaiC/GvpD/RAD55 family RecA-like ATPase
MFYPVTDNAFAELKDRAALIDSALRFNVQFLDDACRGILREDLVLLGAPSGAGKTQICCNIALANMLQGKRVHYIALEAAEFEIERRLKYPLVMERFFADPGRPKIDGKINYADWILGKYISELNNYENQAAEFFEKAYGNLFLYDKQDRFSVNELIKAVTMHSKLADLLIVDHVHYFDFDDDNENRAIKEISKLAMSLVQEEKKPIILIAHLRKRNKENSEVVADMDEFHGSSDLFKIATKVITIAPGKVTPDGKYETFFRIPKNRTDSSSSRFIAREFFCPKRGGYEPNRYELGWPEQKRGGLFKPIPKNFLPTWARPGADVSCDAPIHPGQHWFAKD